MKQQSLQVFEEAEIRDGGQTVAGDVEVVKVNVLVEILDGLDVVVSEREPGEEVDFLKSLTFVYLAGWW